MIMQIRPPKNSDEVDGAYELACRSFGPDYFTAADRISSLYAEELAAFDNMMIVAQGGRIVGALFIAPLELSWPGQRLAAGGITNVCIHPEHRKYGLGGKLMLAAIAHMKRLGYRLSVLFARRAVDDFYVKYGYLGTGSYCELSVELPAPAAGRGRTDGSSFRSTPDPAALGRYAAMYRQTYSGVPFSFVRPARWWRVLEKRLKIRLPAGTFHELRRGGKPVGYFVRDGARVVEAACLSGRRREFHDALAGFARSRGLPSLTLALPRQHPSWVHFQAHNHSEKRRRAWNGGHMLKLLDWGILAPLLRSSLGAEGPRSFPRDRVAAAQAGLDRLAAGVRRLPDSPQESAALKRFLTGTADPVLAGLAGAFSHSWSALDEF